MKKLLGSTGSKLLAGATVVVLVVLIVLLIWARDLVVPFLITVLVIGLAWVGTDLLLKAMRRRKQAAFDEGVAAKEGIDDRKREWAGWTAELAAQGIDRYELPYYLLVGEPQSGKSVLLQNSDLNFPFGQSRLSGIGGTRGCDWWFTEEAVILDLAGRLFTHEGGAADELEWQAFLDLLSDFRPLCPANGVLLVIPCDGLLSDSPEQMTAKANKIQSALLTLTNKLQAQLPVYLMLTKGDKIFGFAESMHRLDAPKRHEMFGWSRPAEESEAPFDLGEVKQAFGELQERARLLRGEMLASARLPEALPEVDRLYAFPDELRALEPGLELYLQRIFTESSLVDRLAFRGFYLTSGLQSGVPVAKVCADLLGGETGEADARSLEGLFSKQRAYFIKDLVRKRVFSERGLVRPTHTRVVRARRNASIGYGVAAVIALVAVIGSIAHLVRGRTEEEQNLYALAIARAENTASEEQDLPAMLASLDAVVQAVRWQGDSVDQVFASIREEFKGLYARMVDDRMVPLLRERAEVTLRAQLDTKPDGYPKSVAQRQGVELLLGTVDFDDRDQVGRLTALIPERERMARTEQDGARYALTLVKALELRGEYSSEAALSPPTNAAGLHSKDLIESSQIVRERLDRTLEPGVGWQPGADLGYALAWMGLVESHARFNDPDFVRSDEVHVFTERYVGSLEALARSQAELGKGEQGKLLDKSKIESQLKAIEAERREFLALDPETEPGAENWLQAAQARSFYEALFPTAEGGSLKDAAAAAVGLGKGPTIDVPTQKLTDLKDDLLAQACARNLLPSTLWKAEQLAGDLQRGRTTFVESEEPQRAALARRAFQAKARRVGAEFTRRYGDWRPLARDLGETPGEAGQVALATRTVTELARLRSELTAIDKDLYGPWIAHVETLLTAHLEEVDAGWARVYAVRTSAAKPVIDWKVLGALAQAARVRGTQTLSARLAAKLEGDYRRKIGDETLAWWSSQDDSAASTVVIVEGLKDYLGRVFAAADRARLEQDSFHLDWLGNVDLLLSDRLATHEQALREHWRGTQYLSAVPLTQAAVTTRAALKATKIQELIDQRPEQDLERLDRDPEHPDYASLPKSKAVVARLAKLTPPLSGASVARHRYVQRLDPFVQTFETSGAQLDGPGLAALLRAWRLDAQANLQPEKTAGGHYVREVAQSFEERVVQEIRKTYASSFEDKIIEPFEAVMAALEAEGDTQLSKIDDGNLVTELSALFDRNRALDELRQSYRLDESFDFRPAAGEATAESSGVWRTNRFLEELQAFLLGKAKRLDEVKLAFAIIPTTTDTDSIWNTGANGGLAAFFYPDATLGQEKYERITESMERAAIEWRFTVKRDKKLALRWSKTHDANTSAPDDARLVLSGTLAPLVLAWSGTPSESGDEWTVRAQPQGSQLSAPFRILFLSGGSLPRRPAELR